MAPEEEEEGEEEEGSWIPISKMDYSSNIAIYWPADRERWSGDSIGYATSNLPANPSGS